MLYTQKRINEVYAVMRILTSNTQRRVFGAKGIPMAIIARTPKQIGDAIRRWRRQEKLTQSQLGDRMSARQATVSKLEAGEPATQLRTLMDALAALDLELVVQPRNKGAASSIEDLF